MKITVTVYVDPKPEQTMDELLKLPMPVAQAFAQAIDQDHLRFIKGFDVACDTEQTRVNSKTVGVPYELLKQLSEEQKHQ